MSGIAVLSRLFWSLECKSKDFVQHPRVVNSRIRFENAPLTLIPHMQLNLIIVYPLENQETGETTKTSKESLLASAVARVTRKRRCCVAYSCLTRASYTGLLTARHSLR
ncbi:hypothetical protein E2C01_019191 [Portunus trituberculatus]|uniref:Uncharacterized protein n=1 Tax=Portunus trituberculatus TaxID=210409 RepID=A0A5B7DWM1_PORTR|nr:hypothetical protein [Portunus trituberculatus]